MSGYMDRTERFMKIDLLLQRKKATPLALLIEELEVSRATVKRDIEYMRDRMHAPIVWDRELRGYRYQLSGEGIPGFSLPGLWFNASEVHALLTMDHLLSNLQPGLLGPHIEPLRQRIHALLEHGDHSVEEIATRIHISQLAERPVDADVFEAISSALLSRKRVILLHYHRGKDTTVEREVSPQRLVYYRDNWYLDAWCHLRKGLRSFAVDAIKETKPTDKKARNVSEKNLNEVYRAGYGIFAGKSTHKAVLRFTEERARWVSREIWHSEQESYFDEDGRYVLTIPYSNDTELVMDIMRYGAGVEVLSPRILREKIIRFFEQALNHYTDK
jgi:predicted DNA-binding transcriptional regulator YafY